MSSQSQIATEIAWYNPQFDHFEYAYIISQGTWIMVFGEMNAPNN